MEPMSGQVHNPSLQPRNEQVVKYGEQRQEGVRSMPKEADLRSKTPARGQAFENLSRWLRLRVGTRGGKPTRLFAGKAEWIVR